LYHSELIDVEAGAKLRAADLLPWLRKIDRLIVLAAGFNDKMGESDLKQQLADMSDMYRIVSGEAAPQDVKGESSDTAAVRESADETMRSGLSKNLRDALGRLSTEKEATAMSEQLADRLELESAHMEDSVEFSLDPPAEAEEWSEGVEDLKNATPETLYRLLGLDEPHIPGFNKYIVEDVEAGGEAKEFHMRWHQLVGTVKLLERALTSDPVLLMDDVGLGKTTQVLAMFTMLTYYRTYHKTNGRYPSGNWGEQSGRDSGLGKGN
jgi:hypothetical protein